MIYNASIFVETIPKRTWFNRNSKPLTYKLTQFVLHADSREEAEIKMENEVDKYKEASPKLFADKIIKTFVLPVK